MKQVSALSITALMALCASMAPLQGQDVGFGLQLHGNLPMGDLKDATNSKVGIGGGAHMILDFGDGHKLRPRLDYVVYPENSGFADLSFGASATGKYKVSDASLGADYIYDFGGKEGGFYVTAGLALHRWKADYDYSVRVGTITTSGTSSTTSSKVGAAVGAGFNFNANFGVEARYVATKFPQGSQDATAGSVQLSALYRF